jgi:hypothetical protein
VIPSPKANRFLKVRHGMIKEIGIASRQLTTTHGDQAWLFALQILCGVRMLAAL